MDYRKTARLLCAGVVGLCCSLTMSGDTLADTSAANDSPSRHIVWSELSGGGAQVRYARQIPQSWTPAQAVTSGDHLDVAPCIVVNQAGHRWVVWTRMETMFKSWLMIRQFDGEKWLPAERIETGVSSNTGAMLLQSPGPSGEMRLWVFWSGFDGEDDEIFYSYQEPNGQWRSAGRIAANNTFPDIQPLAGLSADGTPWVMWHGYNGSDYVRQSVRWDETRFVAPELVDPQDARLTLISEVSEHIPGWPGEISKPKSACMTQPSALLPVLPLRMADKKFVLIDGR